ncbi:MAG: hypothetical protein RIT45_3762 [Pseudomonadota bacterium]|jgi:hypothetical protein
MRRMLLLLALVPSIGGCLPDTLDDATLADRIEKAQYGSSCPAQVDCVLACASDTSCEQACLPGTVDGVSETATALSQCAQTCMGNNCASLQGAARDSCERSCVTYRCAADAFACVGTASGGGGQCFDLQACFDGCPAPAVGGTAACAAACVAGLTNDDFDYAGAYATCQSTAVKSGKDPRDACIAELATCYASGTSGAGACHEAFGCVGACEVGGGATNNCFADCLPKLSVAAQSTFLSYVVCADDNGTDHLACKTPLISCAAPSGQQNCKELFDVFEACLKTKGTSAGATCLVESLHGGTSNAAAPFIDAVACYAKNCTSQCASGGVPCQTCLTKNCGKQVAACSTPK